MVVNFNFWVGNCQHNSCAINSYDEKATGLFLSWTQRNWPVVALGVGFKGSMPFPPGWVQWWMTKWESQALVWSVKLVSVFHVYFRASLLLVGWQEERLAPINGGIRRGGTRGQIFFYIGMPHNGVLPCLWYVTRAHSGCLSFKLSDLIRY